MAELPTITARFRGHCGLCGGVVARGKSVIFDRQHHAIFCLDCYDRAIHPDADPPTYVQDPDGYRAKSREFADILKSRQAPPHDLTATARGTRRHHPDCEHRDTTWAPDGAGAYCRECGETVA